MKVLLPFTLLALFLLGACETVEIEKLIYDTVYVDRPIKSLVQIRDTVYRDLLRVDTVIIVDTVTVNVIVHDTVIRNVHTTDTLIQVVTKDSLIIKEVVKTVTEYDTVFIVNNTVDTVRIVDTVQVVVVRNQVLYHDSIYYPQMIRPVNSIPGELQEFVNDFYSQAGGRGWSVLGGPMIVSYVHADNLPGESWNSHSYWIGGANYGQMVIEVNEELPTEQQRASILRELARLQLKKRYLTDESKIMCPWFNPATQITTNHLNELFGNPQPI